ncbi:MAG: peptidoglycan-binding protein [Calothrix sp. MO_167.B42]|nr:peptidoglycan-binding protein [Calothrix sp. MO_167.B42]
MNTEIKCPHQQPRLQFGAKIPIVREMQVALNKQLGQLDTMSKFPLYIPVTGFFGEETHNAVKYLQCLAFLKIDGIVGKQTWAYLCYGAGSLPHLRFGCSDRLVATVQGLLSSHGYYTGVIDGIFGIQTAEAIRTFQVQSHLIVDGMITESTWMNLSKLKTHTYNCSNRIFGNSLNTD